MVGPFGEGFDDFVAEVAASRQAMRDKALRRNPIFYNCAKPYDLFVLSKNDRSSTNNTCRAAGFSQSEDIDRCGTAIGFTVDDLFYDLGRVSGRRLYKGGKLHGGAEAAFREAIDKATKDQDFHGIGYSAARCSDFSKEDLDEYGRTKSPEALARYRAVNPACVRAVQGALFNIQGCLLSKRARR